MHLAQRAQTGTTPWTRAGLALAAVGAIAVSTVIVAWLIAAAFSSATSIDGRATDQSYDRVESNRGSLVLPAATTDQSYEQVEANRGTLILPAPPVDPSYDQVERIRAAGPGA